MIDLAGYTDLAPIGHGGLGDVYRARDTSSGATVAVKVLRDVSDESTAWHRTRRELTALASLGGHAHVIGLLGLLDERPGLVMEFAPGGSVAGLIARRDVTLDEAVLIGRQTASALVAAHARGIVHRDVKPQNLLIDADGQVKLCDFGIASLARTEEFRTRTSAISLRYASPEDLEDDADVGPPADVYSLGATLLHLTHGAPPTLKDRLGPWRPPTTDDPDLAALDAVVASCLDPDPRHRPSAGEIQERLEALPCACHSLPVESGETAEEALPGPADPVGVPAGDEPTQYRTGRTPRSAPRPEPEPSQRRWRFAIPIAAVVALFGGWFLLGGGDVDAPAFTVVARPDGLPPLDEPTIRWPFGAVGECLVQLPDDDTLAAVECTEPHDLERFATGELADTTVTPDRATVTDLVSEACEGGPTNGGLAVAWTTPSSAGWEGGDRRYQCFVGVPGSRLVGSALTSGT